MFNNCQGAGTEGATVSLFILNVVVASSNNRHLRKTFGFDKIFSPYTTLLPRHFNNIFIFYCRKTVIPVLFSSTTRIIRNCICGIVKSHYNSDIEKQENTFNAFKDELATVISKLWVSTFSDTEVYIQFWIKKSVLVQNKLCSYFPSRIFSIILKIVVL